MEGLEPKVGYSKSTILKQLIHIISDMLRDADVEFAGPITSDTCLIADLGFQSLDMVVLIGEIRNPHRFPYLKDMVLDIEPFILSREPGDDISISALVDFLYDHSTL
jgi:hypothetical protein